MQMSVENENLIRVSRFDSLAEAEEYALVILAMGEECLILDMPEGFEILTGESRNDSIREEFAAYAREKAGQTARELNHDPPLFQSGLELALVWVLALFVVFHFQVEDSEVIERFSNSNLALFDRGEWWRPLTALFLHADFAHLLGNAIYGLVFFQLVARSVGPWFGWFLILSSGVLGNFLSAWLRYPHDVRSLGASTATFGALGILVGVSIVAAWKARSYHKLKGVIAPIGAGTLLLGWLGSGEAPADVLGHVLGFLSGCGLGWAAGLLRNTQGAN